jgi:hypothetical protein
MLHTRWSAEAGPQVKAEFVKALALRSEIRRAGWLASSDELPSPDRLLLRRYHYHSAGRVGADVPRRAAQRDVEQAPLAVASDH